VGQVNALYSGASFRALLRATFTRYTVVNCPVTTMGLVSVIYCGASVCVDLWGKYPRSTLSSVRFIHLGKYLRSNLEQVTAIYSGESVCALLWGE
jgi:hypothetical protein